MFLVLVVILSGVVLKLVSVGSGWVSCGFCGLVGVSMLLVVVVVGVVGLVVMGVFIFDMVFNGVFMLLVSGGNVLLNLVLGMIGVLFLGLVIGWFGMDVWLVFGVLGFMVGVVFGFVIWVNLDVEDVISVMVS